ncbi:hypothetical protein N2382_04210 [SAR92 clade bacterium H921]|nr:hypothetical protein [SAR92 clade bacterium H921]
MRVEKNPVEFNLQPSKAIVLAQLGLALTVSISLLGLAIIWWVRLLALAIILGTTALWVHRWRAQKPELLRSLDAERWILGDTRLILQPRQFVVRKLVILYFKTSHGATLVRALPEDAMADGQHRLLRKLLLAS